MPAMNSVLSISGMAATGILGGSPVAIELVAETGSTNADLLARAGTLPGPTLLIAERQTAGRGRAGRAWHSAPGATLTFSLAWPFKHGVQQLLGLPLAVGVSLAQALAALDVPVTLKWPNDVLKGGRKLAGILIETASIRHQEMQQEATWAVVGIGLNLHMPDSLEAQIGHPVAAVPWLALQDHNVLMATIVKHLAATLGQFADHGFRPFVASWNALHAYAGQQVQITENGCLLQQGRAVGVDEMGRLLLDTATGCSTVMAGDVSLRLVDLPGPQLVREGQA